MKRLVYQVESYQKVFNPETEEVEQQPCLAKVVIKNPTEKNIEKAKELAYNGEYIIEDDGQPEPETTNAVLNALLGVTV